MRYGWAARRLPSPLDRVRHQPGRSRADCSWCWDIPVREPRLAVAQTGKNASPLLGGDVVNLAPDAKAVLDAHSAIFPLESLNQLKPGTYAVQALLHTNPDLNFPNAPGDLYSPVTMVRIDPAQAGTVRLELSQAVPQETLPVDSELIKYVKIHSKRLSDFHGRPIHLRAA